MDEKKYFQVIDPDQRGPVAPMAPTCLYLEVANECNLTCKTCPLTYGRVESPALLSLEKVRYLVSQFPSAAGPDGEWEYARFTPNGQPPPNVDTKSCLQCHKPMSGQDFVFTFPQLRAAPR